MFLYWNGFQLVAPFAGPVLGTWVGDPETNLESDLIWFQAECGQLWMKKITRTPLPCFFVKLLSATPLLALSIQCMSFNVYVFVLKWFSTGGAFCRASAGYLSRRSRNKPRVWSHLIADCSFRGKWHRRWKNLEVKLVWGIPCLCKIWGKTSI